MQRGLRLTRSSEFQRAYQEGARFPHDLVVLYVRPNEMDRVRVGVVTGRRLGTATVRNRVRRRLREAVRADLPRLRPGLDLVVVARSAAAGADYQQLRGAIQRLLERAGAYAAPGEAR